LFLRNNYPSRPSTIVLNPRSIFSIFPFVGSSPALCRAQHFMNRNQTTLEQALEELSRIPADED
jgi:hypothetical protein